MIHHHASPFLPQFVRPFRGYQGKCHQSLPSRWMALQDSYAPNTQAFYRRPIPPSEHIHVFRRSWSRTKCCPSLLDSLARDCLFAPSSCRNMVLLSANVMGEQNNFHRYYLLPMYSTKVPWALQSHYLPRRHVQIYQQSARFAFGMRRTQRAMEGFFSLSHTNGTAGTSTAMC